jgi:hypothetical protein
MLALALIVGAYEVMTGVQTWRNAGALYGSEDPWDARYFTALTTWGYELSEIEQLVVDGPAKARAAREAREAGQAAVGGAGEPGVDDDGGEAEPDDFNPDGLDDDLGPDDDDIED